MSEFRPHIVHLTGHGAVLEGEGLFAFEKEDGTADLVSSTELHRFLAGSDVQCVFVSGRQSGKAPREALAGVCQGLVGDGEVPLSVGWAASIADDLATKFARIFYRTLKSGQPVDLNEGGSAIRRLSIRRIVIFATLVLFVLFDRRLT